MIRLVDAEHKGKELFFESIAVLFSSHTHNGKGLSFDSSFFLFSQLLSQLQTRDLYSLKRLFQ